MEEYLDRLVKAKEIEDAEEEYQKVIDEGDNLAEVEHCRHCLEELERVK